MTKEDVDLAGTLGVLVIRLASEKPKQEQERYRILSLSKEYPEQYERERGKKAVQAVTLVDGMRRTVKTRLDMIEPADPVGFAALKAAYLAGKPVDTEKPEPEKEKPKAKREVFRAPTVEEVAAYAADKLLNVDARAFVDHYEACGWVVGKNKPMKSWQAAVRQWDRREAEFSAGKKNPEEKPSSFDTDTFFEAALQNSYGGVV